MDAHRNPVVVMPHHEGAVVEPTRECGRESLPWFTQGVQVEVRRVHAPEVELAAHLLCGLLGVLPSEVLHVAVEGMEAFEVVGGGVSVDKEPGVVGGRSEFPQ